MTTFDINFYCRKSKTNKKGLAHIEMSISINGQRNFINLPLMVSPSDFAKKKQPQYIREYLTIMMEKANNALVTLTKESMEITPATIRSYILKEEKTITIGSLMKEFLEIQIKKDIQPRQYRKYELSLNEIYNYLTPDDTPEKITNALIKNLHVDTYRKFLPGTACGYMTRIKAFITYMKDNGHITTNPFNGIKISKGKTELQMITPEDLNSIISHSYISERVQKVADLFAFCCGSGISYADVCHITSTDFSTENDTTYIYRNRQKTNEKYCAVILPFAVDIAKKYAYDLKALCISNQKLNQYLKEIQDVCGIRSVKSLHFHLARHFYCNYLLNKGVRAETVARAVGHSSPKTTLKYYAKIDVSTTINEISKIF